MLLFGEGQSRIILSLSEENFEALNQLAKEMNVKLSVLGKVKPDIINVRIRRNGSVAGEINVSLGKITEVSKNAIKRRVENVR